MVERVPLVGALTISKTNTFISILVALRETITGVSNAVFCDVGEATGVVGGVGNIASVSVFVLPPVTVPVTVLVPTSMILTEFVESFATYAF